MMRSRKIRFTPIASAMLLLAAVWMASVGAIATGRKELQSQATAEQLAALTDEGATLFGAECAACHGAEGNEGAAPALAGNGSLANKEHVVKQILDGTPARGMPPFGPNLKDRQVAAVATFIRNSWDNAYGIVLEADVTPLRTEIKKDLPH